MLEKIKRRLGIIDTTEDMLLQDLIDDSKAYFLGLARADVFNSKYEYIIVNVVCKMYQRKGSEAVSSESVDGYSVTYESWDDLFKPYLNIITNDFNLDGSHRVKGKVKFV